MASKEKGKHWMYTDPRFAAESFFIRRFVARGVASLAEIYDGTTSFSTRRERIRSIINRSLADTVVDEPNPETYAAAFTRIFQQPLELEGKTRNETHDQGSV